MTKFFRSLLLLLSTTTGLMTLAIGGMLITQRTTSAYDSLQPSQLMLDPFIRSQAALPVAFGPVKAAIEPTPIPQVSKNLSSPKPVPTEVISTPTWMTYDGLDLSEQTMKVTINLACEDKAIVLPEFNLNAWYPGIFEEGKFDVSANSAIAWEHLGYHGLWMHSGQDLLGRALTAFNLHDYLERTAQGKVRTPAEFDKTLSDCLVGSVVTLQAGGKTSLSRITAGARVPAKQVEELSGHVMDLVPYLAEQYPNSGFSELKETGLLFYICGRRLAGETHDPNSFFWAQARIIIAMEPLVIDYFK